MRTGHWVKQDQCNGRKGWTKVEVSDDWVKILRGPKPPSVRWSKAKPAEPGAAGDSRRRVPTQVATPQPRALPLLRWTPEVNRVVAQAKIARIKACIAALGNEDPEEVEMLKKALARRRIRPRCFHLLFRLFKPSNSSRGRRRDWPGPTRESGKLPRC